MITWDRMTELITATFSTLGCLFIIISYAVFPNLRVFACKVSLYLAISGLGTAICIYIGSPSQESSLCIAQGFFFIYFANATITATTYISYVLLQVFYRGFAPTSKVTVPYRAMVAIWGIPLIVASLPLFHNAYRLHDDVRMCWIHSTAPNAIGLMLELVCFYIPLGMAMIFNAVVYVALSRRVFQATTNESSDTSSRMIRQALGQVIWFPIILIVSYAFLVSFKILAVLGYDNHWLTRLMIVSGIHGFLFCLAFAALPMVKQQWKLVFRNILGDPKQFFLKILKDPNSCAKTMDLDDAVCMTTSTNNLSCALLSYSDEEGGPVSCSLRASTPISAAKQMKQQNTPSTDLIGRGSDSSGSEISFAPEMISFPRDSCDHSSVSTDDGESVLNNKESIRRMLYKHHDFGGSFNCDWNLDDDDSIEC